MSPLMHDKLQSAPNKAIQTWDTEGGAALCGPQQESLKNRRDPDRPAESLVSKNPSTTLTGRGRRDISRGTTSDGTRAMPDASAVQCDRAAKLLRTQAPLIPKMQIYCVKHELSAEQNA